MAKLARRASRGEARPLYMRTALSSLRRGFEERGLDVQLDSEHVPGTRLHRVAVLSPRFQRMRHGERQDLAWRIATEVLTDEQRKRIGMILVLTPRELNGKA